MKTKKIQIKSLLRFFVAVLTLMIMLSNPFSGKVFAASGLADLLPSATYVALKSKLPVVTYAMPLSGASKVYAYSSSSLKTKQTDYYISAFSDQIVITGMSVNGKAVKVTYPSSSASSGYRSKWFKADDILGLTTVDVNSYTATKSSTTYRMKSNSAVSSYGSIAKNDGCVRLGTHKIGTKTYYPTVYNISSTTVNKVSKIKYKLALATVKEFKGVTLSSASLSVVKGKTGTITATLFNTGSSKITAKSSNTNVATVSVSGKKVTVKGVKSGTATVTVTSGSYKATTKVTVTDAAQYISSEELEKTAKEYGISTSSNAYKALQSINSKYQSKLTSKNKKGTCVFMFEGVGNNSSAKKRLNAMCVVVKNGDIVYVNRNSSTIPDYPFRPDKNGNKAMPTLKSGIYSFTTKNHKGEYAALNVSKAKVVRFKSASSFYNGTSPSINVHRRSANTIASASATWVNSAGCLLVGSKGTDTNSEYAKFIKAVGIVGSSATGTSKYSKKVSGKIIVDRSYASDYLHNIGYSATAIKKIG